MVAELHADSRDEPAVAISHCRRFGIGDAMILVAAVAVGLAVNQSSFSNLWRDLRPIVYLEKGVLPLDKITGRINWPFVVRHQLGSILNLANTVVAGFLLCLSPAFLIIRLRRPRPPLRVLIRQPGVAAHESLFVLFGVGLIFSLISSWVTLSPFTIDSVILLILTLGASAIPLTWVYLARSGKGCPERGWIDLLGRILGACWTVVYMVSAVSVGTFYFYF